MRTKQVYSGKETPLSGERADAARECRELFFAVGRHRHWWPSQLWLAPGSSQEVENEGGVTFDIDARGRIECWRGLDCTRRVFQGKGCNCFLPMRCGSCQKISVWLGPLRSCLRVPEGGGNRAGRWDVQVPVPRVAPGMELHLSKSRKL